MRIALTLLVVVASLVAGGCSSGGGTSCHPNCERCCTWQPNCCNSWDWYVPCDMIEGRELRQGTGCEQVVHCNCK
jgi:hypothetical protein